MYQPWQVPRRRMWFRPTGTPSNRGSKGKFHSVSIFRIRKHLVSVFIFQDRAVQAGLPVNEARDARSFHLESWKQGELRYFVIGDTGPEDLRALKDLLA